MFFDCATQWTRQQERANKTCAKISANIQATQLEIERSVVSSWFTITSVAHITSYICSETSYLSNVRETRQLENDIADLEQQHADLTLGSVNPSPVY